MTQPPIVYPHIVAGLTVALVATAFLLAGLAIIALAANYLKRRYDVN